MRYLHKGGEKNEEKLEKKFERIIKAICIAYRVEHESKLNVENRAVINDPDMKKLVESTAEEALGNSNKIIYYIPNAGEDFAEFAVGV